MSDVRPPAAPVHFSPGELSALPAVPISLRSRVRLFLDRHAASGLRVGLGLLLGAVFTALVLRTVDLDAVYDLLAKASVLPVVVGLCAFVLDFVLRAARFSWMLRLATGQPVPLRRSVGPYIASFGVSDILPLRIGDGFRILWFSRRFAIPVGTLAGTMIMERVFDLLTIVILCGLCLAWMDAPEATLLVQVLQLALAVSLVGGLCLLFGPSLLARALGYLSRRFQIAFLDRPAAFLQVSAQAIGSVRSWRHVGSLAVLSLGLWLLESVAMIGAWVSLGGDVGAWLKPLLAFSFSTLGTMVPSLPGHFGTFEFFGLQAFKLGAVDENMAAAVLLLAHLVIWLPTALFGIGWLLFGANVSKGQVVPVSRAERG